MSKNLVLSALLLLLPAALLAGAPATRPTAAVAASGCVTAECHAGVKNYTHVHAPTAANDCESCHELTDATKHTFSMPRQKAEMCLFCHESPAARLPVVHKPLTQGECLGCHNPHGGNSTGSLREKTIAQTCGSCHENVVHGKAFVHAPVAQGECTSCHPPHASRFPKLLDAVGTDLCLACHKEMEAPLAQAKSRHKALDDGCEKCHDAHGSANPMSLVKPQQQLCFSCHDHLRQKVESSAVPHSAISQDRGCMNCHAPHASSMPRLQNQAPAATCLKCHDKPIKTDRGYTVAAAGETVDPKLDKHGEIKDGQCAGCHSLHAGDRRMLLKKPYTQGFYQQFSAENYALCFSCHDVKLAQSPETTTATSFRNGSRNLHYLHANSGERDKSCGTCHASHAAANDRLIRPTFHFGKRDLPVAFTKNPTGGSCAPGCHAAYAYDREKAVPVPKATTQATSAPAPTTAPLPRAERQESRYVNWTARSAAGGEVKIPDAIGRPTAVVVLAAADPLSGRLVEKIKKNLPPDSDAQIVLLLVGNTEARDLAAINSKAAAWPIVLDVSGAAANTLEAPARPSAIIIRGDGLELTRVAGPSDFFATKLRAYLEVAGGRLTPAAATTQISPAPLSEASAARQAARDLRAAETLLEQGKATEAWARLGEIKNTAAATQLLRARVLLELKRYRDAMALVDRLPPGAVPPAQADLVRAAVLISQDRWSLARPMLEQLVAADPKLAAAHMLLAKVYEHDQNWKQAAEQYRLAAESR